MNAFSDTLDLSGLTVLLTAGPTQEAIDPVRYISNHSTDKMGYAPAEELANAQSKLVRKKLDLIVINSLRDKGADFSHDTNRIPILHRNGDVQSYGLKTKQAVAHDIVAAATTYLPHLSLV